MKMLNFCLRFIAALIMPLIALAGIWWLGDTKLYPDGFMRLEDGRNLIAVLTSGFAAGFCFSSLVYSIAPCFKKVFVVGEVLIMFARFFFSMAFCKQRGIALTADWIVWMRVILCGAGMLFPFLMLLQKTIKGKFSKQVGSSIATTP